jgi:hypothetical protein
MLKIQNFEERLTPLISKSSFLGWYIMEAVEIYNDYYLIQLQKNSTNDFNWVALWLGKEVDTDFPSDDGFYSDGMYKLKFVGRDGITIYEHWLSYEWLKKTTAIGFMNKMASVIDRFVVKHPNNKWPVV